MIGLSPLQAIANRRNAISIEIESLKAEYTSKIEALETERGELEIAAKVFQRLAASEAQQTLPVYNGESSLKEKPTMPIMLKSIIEQSVGAGLPGITGPDIVAAATRQWGADINPAHVRSTLWRMVQEDRLTQNGNLYSLPQDKPHEEQQQEG